MNRAGEMSLVVGEFHYVNEVPMAGWLAVAVKSTRAQIPFLEYTKIKINEVVRHRNYIEVIDGVQQGVIAGLSEIHADAYFGEISPYQGLARIVVNYGAAEEFIRN